MRGKAAEGRAFPQDRCLRNIYKKRKECFGLRRMAKATIRSGMAEQVKLSVRPEYLKALMLAKLPKSRTEIGAFTTH
jgi:hypothetical protein